MNILPASFKLLGSTVEPLSNVPRFICEALKRSGYSRILKYALVGSSGLEPPTSRLSGARSNHLSYEPIFRGLLCGSHLFPWWR